MQTKSDRVTVRLPNNQREIMERAANYRGATFNQFLINAGIQAAIKVINEEEQLHISSETAEYFFDMMDCAPERSEKLAILSANVEEKRIAHGRYTHNITRSTT